jgi:hypothetical protein
MNLQSLIYRSLFSDEEVGSLWKESGVVYIKALPQPLSGVKQYNHKNTD